MPRPSKNRHVVSRLRQVLGLRQKELASLAGCSRIYIQAVELHQRPLTEQLARKLAAATGVALDWLLKEDYRTPPVTAGGQPLTPKTFEAHEAWSKVRPATDEEMKAFRSQTRGLTVGFKGPALKQRVSRKDLKGVPFELELSDQKGRVVAVPKSIKAAAVAKAMQEDADAALERQRLVARAYGLLERTWAVLRAAWPQEDRWLHLHRLEEGVEAVIKKGKLTVPEELTGKELEQLAEHFKVRSQAPPFTTISASG